MAQLAKLAVAAQPVDAWIVRFYLVPPEVAVLAGRAAVLKGHGDPTPAILVLAVMEPVAPEKLAVVSCGAAVQLAKPVSELTLAGVLVCLPGRVNAFGNGKVVLPAAGHLASPVSRSASSLSAFLLAGYGSAQSQVTFQCSQK